MAGKKSKGRKKPGGNSKAQQTTVSRPSPPDGIDGSPANHSKDEVDSHGARAHESSNSVPAAGGDSVAGGSFLSFLAQQSISRSGASRTAASGRRAVWAEDPATGDGPGTSADARSSSGPGSSFRDGDLRRRVGGERERDRDMGERDRDKDKGGGVPGDECHNGEGLATSPLIKLSAEKQWSWLSYSTKQFRLFAQESPPMLDVGADEVRSKVEDIKCGTCRDRLLEALNTGLARGGFPLTKLVKLAACNGGEHIKRDARRLGWAQGAEASLSASGKDQPVGQADRLRIRAPVTPDLLRQVIGVVQAAATAPGGTAAAAGEGDGISAEVSLGDLTADEWLYTFPAPTGALLSGEGPNGMHGIRGTGSGTLDVQHARFPGSECTRDLWTLMERAERAKDNAFKCCGVIEASTGVGLHDPSAGSAGSASGTGNGTGLPSMPSNIDWNPQFAPRLQEAETALVDWLTELTMALHGLSFPFTLAFITDGLSLNSKNDLAETAALTEDVWAAYEESVKRQLELTLEARREQLREQSQPMGIALCFAAQNRANAAELLERKRAEMTALHEATIGVLRAPDRQPLLRRAEAAREKWSGLLMGDGFHALDDLGERVLRARLQVFKCESFAYNASSDVIQAEQVADTQLKGVLQEWEGMMETFKAAAEERVAEELNPTVYPQSPALTEAIANWLSTFKHDWVGNETTQQLHAHIRQRQVHGLCQTLVQNKQRLKTSKEEAAELNKQRRKKDTRSSEQSEDLQNYQSRQRELEERCSLLATAISLTQQEQIETCLTFRLFAVGQLHQRYRKLRLFFAQLGCRVASRASQATHLCGAEADAEERIKIVGACLVLGIVEEACLRWTAVQNERQLVEGMNREDASLDAKRRKRERAKAKVRETKTAAATAAAAAEEAAAVKAEAEAEATRAANADSVAPNTELAQDIIGIGVDGATPRNTGGVNGKRGNDKERQSRPAESCIGSSRQTEFAPVEGGAAGKSNNNNRRSDSPSRGPPATAHGPFQGGRWPGKGGKDVEEWSGGGWRGAERIAPAADEDGFVTIAKSRPRRSARDVSLQNGRGGWGRGTGEGGKGRGGSTWHGEISGRPNGYGHDGGLDRARETRPQELERRGKFTTAGAGGIARTNRAASVAPPPSAAASTGTWVQRNKPASEQHPEVCVATEPSVALAPVANGWPVPSSDHYFSASSGVGAVVSGERATGWNGSRNKTRPAHDTSTEAAVAANLTASASSRTPSELTGNAPLSLRDGGEAAGGGSSARPVQTQLRPDAGAWGAGGSPVAPEEEIPEAVPVPTETAEEAAAGGQAKSAGEFSGGEKVVGAGQLMDTGAGGAAATASAVLGPESEVARVTSETGGMDVRMASDAAGREGGMVVEEDGREEEEAEEFVFQFGTVNLPDDDSAVDVGGEGGNEEAPRGLDSPENSRYGNGEEEAEEKEVLVMESDAADHGVESDSVFGFLIGSGHQQMSAGDETNNDFDAATVADVGGGIRQPVLHTLQTEQLRDGVFFPAHPPPPPQGGGVYMAPPYQPQHHGPIQQQQHQQLPHQQHHSSMTQQQLPPQRGFSPAGGGGMNGMQSQQPHQHQLQHQHHSHNPYSTNNQRGMGMGGHHPPHSPNNGGLLGGGMHLPATGSQGHYQHHRRSPSQPKGLGGSRYSGGGGPHSPNTVGYSDMGQYGSGPPAHSVVQQSAANGYWGGGMMHYQVPGQPMMGPAPGGIGVTDGQAVYYPPPPHMMVQGDAPGHGHGGTLWHPGPHMAMGMGSSMNMIMDMNGVPSWISDGAQHYMHPSAPGWGSPTRHSMSGYVPPPQHQQQAPPTPPPPHPPLHAQPLEMSVQGRQQHHHHQRQGSAEQHGSRVVTTPIAPTQLAVLTRPFPPTQPDEIQAVDDSGNSDDSSLVLGVAPTGTAPTKGLEPPSSDAEPAEPMMAPESDSALASTRAGAAPVEMEFAPVRSGELGDLKGEIGAYQLAGEEAAEAVQEAVDKGARMVSGTDRGMAQSGTEAAETVAVKVVDQTVYGAIANSDDVSPSEEVEEERSGDRARREDAGEAAAVFVTAPASVFAPARQKKSKKEKGKKGPAGAQGQPQGVSRQASSINSNGVDSPGSEGRGRGKGSKGGSRGASVGVEVEVGRRAGERNSSLSASPPVSAKKDSPPSSAPMPRGLVNAMGQNNCFLNVVVQSLWHLEAFRTRFSGVGRGSPSGAQGAWGKKPQAWGSAGAATKPAVEEPSHRVEASLLGLFRELSAGVESEASSTTAVVDGIKTPRGFPAAGAEGKAADDNGGSNGNGASSASVEALRAALAEISGARFAVGNMDDAAEAMETILGCLVKGSSAAVIRQVFSMRIREALVCPKCGTSSPEKPVEYEANVFYAHVSALREAREKDPNCSFDGALKEASHGDLVTCRNAACPLSRRRELLPSHRSITGEPPSVFSLGLVWNHWGPGLVADLLGMLSPVVDLDVVFAQGPKHRSSRVGGGMGEVSAGKAQLRGFFCFQVQKHHYVAFVYNRGRQEWLLLDDDQAVPIGPNFAGVLARCEEDKLHPSLFFYERQHPMA